MAHSRNASEQIPNLMNRDLVTETDSREVRSGCRRRQRHMLRNTEDEILLGITVIQEEVVTHSHVTESRVVMAGSTVANSKMIRAGSNVAPDTTP